MECTIPGKEEEAESECLAGSGKGDGSRREVAVAEQSGREGS